MSKKHPLEQKEEFIFLVFSLLTDEDRRAFITIYGQDNLTFIDPKSPGFHVVIRSELFGEDTHIDTGPPPSVIESFVDDMAPKLGWELADCSFHRWGEGVAYQAWQVREHVP